MIINLMFAILSSVAFAIFAGPRLIPKLAELKFGQSIREEGPQSHHAKAGTPTMGGLLVLGGIIFSILITRNFTIETLIVLCGLILFGIVGFADDYIKIVMKHNLGLRAYQKLIGQLIAGTITVILGYLYFPTMVVPGTGFDLNIGYFFIPVMVLFFIFASNAVNLTDGLDGLASGITVICSVFLTAAAIKLGNESVAMLSGALGGGALGFLYFNRHPAKIFMGDTGSLAIGGALCALAMVLRLELFTPIFGFVFLAEALSVIIQVISYKTTGKRVFKMSPIHHHFELSGWNETKVVKVFWSVAAIFATIAWFLI